MEIGGLNSVSLSDYPGHIASVVFVQGCNFQCIFCHNGFLIPRDVSHNLLNPEKEVFEFLERRRSQLGGVVVSGGEPTTQPDLLRFLKKVKTMGFLLKLDTNGSRPKVLRNLIENKLVDYIAMDIKASLIRYHEFSRASYSDIKLIEDSINLIASSGICHEFRTTYIPSMMSSWDVELIKELVPPGSKHHFQKFYPEHALVPWLRKRRKI
ncbi:MAG: anaerobic ribonucleoside-triphosphate reductase activating protein [Sedimentisphaerales bacterium]|nr:anaerobic ribonucleoside-triphosphate reductase activating protein [Sedimentisphaerales bacterium]